MHYDNGYVPDGNHETKYGHDSEETLNCQTSSRSKRDRYGQGRNTRRLRYLNSVYAIQEAAVGNAIDTMRANRAHNQRHYINSGMCILTKGLDCHQGYHALQV